jgi:hypothetical protein
MHTIVELPEYLKRASSVLSEKEREDIIEYLSENPKAGDLITGTGGIRKLRWGAKGKGKSGGARLVYFYYNKSIPLFMLTVFGKGEKANISKYERKDLSKLSLLLKNNYGGSNE